MADNLAYGIIALRAGKERDKVFAELQRKNELLRILASELTTVEERERRRMALMLHDELQQQLVGARYNVQFLQHQEDCGKYKHIIERIDDTLKSCLDHSRLLISELSPRVLYELGLGPAVQWLAHEYHEKHGIKVTVSTSPIPQIDEDIAITLFQAVRELLFNVVKHAQVKTASVQLSLAPSGKIQTIVSDHGSGFEPIRLGTAKPMTSGFGLFSMKERLASMGGEIKIKSATNRGTRITITIPPKAVKKRPAFGKTLKKTLFRQSDYNLNPL
jgi:signal transduction histidine kinase